MWNCVMRMTTVCGNSISLVITTAKKKRRLAAATHSLNSGYGSTISIVLFNITFCVRFVSFVTSFYFIVRWIWILRQGRRWMARWYFDNFFSSSLHFCFVFSFFCWFCCARAQIIRHHFVYFRATETDFQESSVLHHWGDSLRRECYFFPIKIHLTISQ